MYRVKINGIVVDFFDTLEQARERFDREYINDFWDQNNIEVVNSSGEAILYVYNNGLLSEFTNFSSRKFC